MKNILNLIATTLVLVMLITLSVSNVDAKSSKKNPTPTPTASATPKPSPTPTPLPTPTPIPVGTVPDECASLAPFTRTVIGTSGPDAVIVHAGESVLAFVGTGNDQIMVHGSPFSHTNVCVVGDLNSGDIFAVGFGSYVTLVTVNQ